MIRHRCPDCHHMMQSSDHLVGLKVPCHVCGELLVVPDTSSSESGSFVLAKAIAKKTDKDAAAIAAAEADELFWERLKELVPRSAKGLWLAALLAVLFLMVLTAGIWWLVTAQ
jgi:hypothetical protein